MKPYPGTVMPDPHPAKLLLIHDTILPQRSAAARSIVSPLSLASDPEDPVLDARLGLTFPHSDAACGFEVSVSSGTDTAFGSALCAYTSAYTTFFASINACQNRGFAGPSVASVCPGYQTGTHCSSTFIASTMPHACEGALVP